jgi:transcriptional regulator with XRE-family HTH domain
LLIMATMKSEKFSDYLRRVMTQKGLNTRDIERNSGRKIDSSHVSKFLRGVETNPSANAMIALAAGLGVNPHDVFTAVTGCPLDAAGTPSPDVMELLSLMEKVAIDPELMEALRGLARLSAEGRGAILELVRFSDEGHQQAEGHKMNEMKRR